MTINNVKIWTTLQNHDPHNSHKTHRGQCPRVRYIIFKHVICFPICSSRCILHLDQTLVDCINGCYILLNRLDSTQLKQEECIFYVMNNGAMQNKFNLTVPIIMYATKKIIRIWCNLFEISTRDTI